MTSENMLITYIIDGNGQPSNDYLDIPEIKVKKPKKSKKSKSSRKRNTEDDDLFLTNIEEMGVGVSVPYPVVLRTGPRLNPIATEI